MSEPLLPLNEANLDLQLRELTDWERFAIHLRGINRVDVDKIRNDHPNSTTDTLKLKLYGKWLSVCNDASWKDVQTALLKVNENTLATKMIATIYKSDESITQTNPAKEYKISIIDEINTKKKLKSLHSSFSKILKNTRKAIECLIESNQLTLQKLASELEDTLHDFDVTGFTDCQDLNGIFDIIKKSSHYLDASVLELVTEEIIGDSENLLLTAIQEHIEKVNEFKSSQPIKSLKNTLEEKEIGKSQTCVIINLGSDTAWDYVRIRLVEKLIKILLDYKGEINWLSVKPGSVQIAIAIPAEFETKAIIYCSQKNLLAYLMGVISIQIGEHTVMEENERMDYTFETALIEASMVGNIEAIELILEIGINVDHTDDQGQTPLMIASDIGHGETVKCLQAAGADVNKQDNIGQTAVMVAKTVDIYQTLVQANYNADIVTHRGSTPLMVSCNNGNHEVANYLLFTLKHNITTRPDGMTLLMAASNGGNTKIVEYLLVNGHHDPNTKNKTGKTALQISCLKGHYTVTEILLKYNANPNTSDNGGRTPLICACQEGHSEIVKLLLPKQVNVNAIVRKNRKSALMLASKIGNDVIVELLLKNNANSSFQDEKGKTAMHIACLYGKYKIVETLLSYDTDANTPDNDGWTPLMCSSQNGHYEIVELLLQKEVNPNTINKKNGNTALMQASRNGHGKIVELLVKNGAEHVQDNTMTAINLSSVNNTGTISEIPQYNPDPVISENNCYHILLMGACQTGHSQVVELVLNKGVDPNIIDRNTKTTAIIIASQNGHYDIVQLLLIHEADPNVHTADSRRTALIQATQNGHDDVAELLLMNNAKPNLQDITGLTALHTSCLLGYHTATESLLEHNADPALADHNGWTPLMSASQEGHHEIVELLLEKDDDPNVVNNVNGNTALIQASQNGHQQAVKTLLRKGAKVNYKNCRNGRTALIHASQNGHDEVVKLLLSNGADPDLQDNEDCTALQRSCFLGYYTATKRLLEHNANPALPDHNGSTPLMSASQAGHHKIVELLIQKIVDLNATKNSNIALIQASQYDQNGTAEVLLQNRAKPNFKHFNGPIALIKSSLSRYFKVVKSHFKHIADARFVEEMEMGH